MDTLDTVIPECISVADAASGIVRNDVFNSRVPSPPYRHVPSLAPRDQANTIKPSSNLVNPYLSAEDIETITGGRHQTTSHSNTHEEWQYERRRMAQPILDFLYLGPMSVVRNHEFLKQHGITLVVVVRDAAMAALPSKSIQDIPKELNLEVEHIDLINNEQLVRNFPAAIDTINEHLLRRNTVAKENPAEKTGRVLVTCQTGNDRSAAVVAAYIMAMYACDVISAIQFVSSKRFCVNYDETVKYILFSYADLLEARRATLLATGQEKAALCQRGGHLSTEPATKKRRIDDAMDGDEEDDFDMDRARYENRAEFVPFSEKKMDI